MLDFFTAALDGAGWLTLVLDRVFVLMIFCFVGVGVIAIVFDFKGGGVGERGKDGQRARSREISRERGKEGKVI